MLTRRHVACTDPPAKTPWNGGHCRLPPGQRRRERGQRKTRKLPWRHAAAHLLLWALFKDLIACPNIISSPVSIHIFPHLPSTLAGAHFRGRAWWFAPVCEIRVNIRAGGEFSSYWLFYNTNLNFLNTPEAYNNLIIPHGCKPYTSTQAPHGKKYIILDRVILKTF